MTNSTLRTVLLVVLILLLVGGIPYGWHAGWGIWPGGGLGVVVLVLVVLMLLGRI